MNKKLIAKLTLFLLVGVVVIGSIYVAYYFFQQNRELKNNPELISQQEVESITQTISRFMELPTDEEPTVATVTDQEKLKDQDFFKNAQNGDKVLIYTNAHKAILYRPSTERVIDFAPFNIGGTQQGESSEVNVKSTKVAIYNGTQTAGLTVKYEELLTQIDGVSIVSKDNASKNDYNQTMVLDLSGNNQDVVGKIAQLLDGQIITQLPDGETRPQADILVIAGK